MSSGIGRWTRLALAALVAAAPAVGSAVLPGGSAHAQEREFAYDEAKEIANAKTGEKLSTSLRVSTTTNLFDRQQVYVELDGFTPTYNAAQTANSGLEMEYPVVVMQCRGISPTPETCVNQRRSVWYTGYDAAAPQEMRNRARSLQGPGSVAGFPGEDFYEQKANALEAEQLGFDAADGTRYLWGGASAIDDEGEPVIDEPTLKSFPPPDSSDGELSLIPTRSIPVRPDKGNEFLFEVRQRGSQPSLGCTDTVVCSIVVVPVMDMACAEDAPTDCAAGPKGARPGESGGAQGNDFLSQRAWFAQSNWQNRYVVPIRFAPDPAGCSVYDQRPVTPVYGSELIDVAQLRWGAAYCAGVREADYLPLYTQGSEYEARRQFTSKLGPKYRQDAVVTTQPVTGSPRPVAHAPSALTGFAVAFSIDDGNGEQVQQLTVSPRLLAKLITQSYSTGEVAANIKDGRTFYDNQAISSQDDADMYYWEHPSIAANPPNIFYDEEFLALNPDLVMTDEDGRRPPQLARINRVDPVIFQVQSDMVVDLTRYITSDPAARAWLDGSPDEQGMVVNPAWKGVGEFELYELRDKVVRPFRPRKEGWFESNAPSSNYFNLVGAGDECNDAFRTPMMTRFANITNSAEASAESLLDRRGSATPTCTVSQYAVPATEQRPPQFPGDDPTKNVVYAETKGTPEDFGTRAMLAVTTVAHARLYETPTASLVNASGDAVAPNAGTMLNALNAAVQDPDSGTIEVDHTKVEGGDAYPGTMVAFTAAPTAGLDEATAGRYADFIEFMATEGQQPGDAITNLPPGYDPLPPNLVRQALDAANAVRDQTGEVPEPPPGGPLGGGMPDEFGGPGAEKAPVSADAAADPGGAVQPQNAADDPRQVAQTEGGDSWLSRWVFLILLGFGLLAAAAAGAVQVASQPDHPVRRALRSVVRR